MPCAGLQEEGSGGGGGAQITVLPVAATLAMTWYYIMLIYSILFSLQSTYMYLLFLFISYNVVKI